MLHLCVFSIGMAVGLAVALAVIFRNGGAWDVGFDDGCKMKETLEELEDQVGELEEFLEVYSKKIKGGCEIVFLHEEDDLK